MLVLFQMPVGSVLFAWVIYDGVPVSKFGTAYDSFNFSAVILISLMYRCREFGTTSVLKFAN